ncbi:hypothetical protein BURPS406E_G0468 [Burkholderia pseudomallei 406e]|uniref:Uncharacterized protein n=2 Tax=Burkholderia pseudomallei TaxID=28450 RepID=A0A0E1VUM6_BURPE|nr:hypothetical protein BURPS668_A1400 [Burkholderia pseudomallei 668]ABN93637.1 hypothetical protein BURPS1106A_A1319 [Burkholderia pseudomallei 1106a]EBA49338.1 hypothetical protein BURPS305_5092 [Burkholderia pseudomallei 305]EDO87040.1 hypothetical protein BURPS406E_G0468 [Burkholderia pseudomallei 406e]EDS82276.1 hypothetical protein BURPSS13_T0445 [Burkholderia pseudomallei S13]EEC38082.1 conserved hypothetical protein [Burkholderia pseudomallei 576]EEH26209.1 conserved hypothetical pro
MNYLLVRGFCRIAFRQIYRRDRSGQSGEKALFKSCFNGVAVRYDLPS